MRYSNRQYAETLLAALADAPEEKRGRIVERFLAVLRRRRESGKTRRILKKAEEIYRGTRGVPYVVIESPEHLSEGRKREVRAIFGPSALIREKRNERLIGGVRIFVNDEWLIDATLRRDLEKIFQ
jgi:F0F1-type ATP synthase delta subunit